METPTDTITAAVALIAKAAVLAGAWAGNKRKRTLQQIAAMTDRPLPRVDFWHRPRNIGGNRPITSA